jgi:alpha-glucoside transport system substrate-binding protein
MKNTIKAVGIVVLTAVMVLSACRSGAGGKVKVLGVWGGSELEVFTKVIADFKQAKNIDVEFEATRDINAVLTTRVEAGNPPEVAILPQLSLVVDFARKGKLVDLSSLVDEDKIRKEYSQTWIDLGSVDGKFYGLFFKTAVKGLVYYDPKRFQELGLEVPKTWDEMLALSKKLVAMHKTPWAIGIESGNASGWPATDWIENIFVRLYGAGPYRQWYDGTLPWTSLQVKKSFQMFGDIATSSGWVYGGRSGILATAFQEAGNPVFTDPPKAYLFEQASFMAGMIEQAFPGLKPVTDINFFVLPPIDPQNKAVEIGGDVLVAFASRPEVKAFLDYMASSAAQSPFAATGATMPNHTVPLAAYGSELDRQFAKILNSAGTVVFDASDMMPSEINAAFWSATIDYVKNPDRLDAILAQLEKTRKDVYK